MEGASGLNQGLTMGGLYKVNIFLENKILRETKKLYLRRTLEGFGEFI